MRTPADALDTSVAGHSHAPHAVEPIACWHCGAEVPPRSRWRAPVAGAERAFCCGGCRAVAATIAGAGLDRYYATRLAAPLAPRENVAAPLPWNAAAGASVRRLGDAGREASLLLDGLTAARARG